MMSSQKVMNAYEGLRTRSHWKREDAARVLSDWVNSGESMSAFAHRHGLGLHRLQWWRGRLGETTATRERQTFRMVPAVVRKAPLIAIEAQSLDRQASACAVRVDATGTHIEVHDVHRVDPHWLAALVSQLQAVRS